MISSCDAFEPDRAGGLHEDGVTRPQVLARGLRDVGCRLDPYRGRVAPSRPANPDDVDPEICGEAADPDVVLVGLLAELGHLPEDGDPPAVARALREVDERGVHRVGIRVVRVVDDEASPGKLRFLPAPRRERDERKTIRHPIERQPERVVRMQRGECVGGEMTLREWKLELDDHSVHREAGRAAERLDLVGREPAEDDVVAREERIEGARRGDDGDSARRQRRNRLGVRLRHPFDGAEELEMLWADVRHEDDRRARDGAQRRDLTQPSHTHLGHEHAGLGLEPAHRQREADLVVEAPLGPDRRNLRRAQRSEDVLRRGLAGRADDRDDLRVALPADERGDRRERGLLVLGDERRGAAFTRLVDVLHAGVERDEEVSGPDLARVRLDGRDLALPDERAERQLCDLVEPQRDHDRPRSASRATSRSSNGVTTPATS